MSTKGACGQDNTPQYQILKNHPIRAGEIHCVKPMSAATQFLETATQALGLNHKTDDRFVVSKAAISSSNGMTRFQNAVAGPVGVEHLGIQNCMKDDTNCVYVPMHSLQTYVIKFVKSTGLINVLSIDVEGHDFDVLFGAGDVLDQIEYLEFEYHKNGNWIHYHLMDAVNLLGIKSLTCYWAGIGKL